MLFVIISKKGIHYLYKAVIEKQYLKTICHHQETLAMPNSDPWYECFFPTLRIMIDSYSTQWLYGLIYFIYISF